MSSVALYTLGCKLNFSETSTIGRELENNGFTKAEFQDGADLYVINTCSVTDHADKKCKKVVKEALKYNPNAFIVVVGCYAQLKPQEIAEIPGVDLVLGAAEKFNLISHLTTLDKQEKTKIYNQDIRSTKDFVPGFSFGDRTRTFLKVQDGCNYFCTFCTIPLARGFSRSDTIQNTVNQAMEASSLGAKEIVLTGCNLGDFGKSHQESFIDLLKQLELQVPIHRIRISSIEPNLLSNQIIDLVAQSNKIVPHFHIPLQSGSNKILKLMRRRYQRELYQEKIQRIKESIPDAAIGVDVIVGFPGETREDFLETYQFLNELAITYLHVFPYSERPNTKAITFEGKVHGTETHERVEMLRILSEKKKQQFNRQHLNTTRLVLFEHEELKGWMSGFTDNYIKVKVPFDPLSVNEVTPVLLEKINEHGEAEGLILDVIHHKQA